MKLSLSWLFSHIKKNPFLEFQSEFEKGNFFERMGATVAEVEHIEKVTYPLDKIFLATVTKLEKLCTLTIAELNKDIALPSRTDLVVGDNCLVIKKGDTFEYLSLHDLHAEKEGLVPAVWVPESEKAGSWKKNLPSFDYILTFDNKALTHRPDLWGHRGFAREVGALYGLELLPEEYIFAQKGVRSFTHSTPAVAGNTIGLENATSTTLSVSGEKSCKRIAGLSIPQITSLGSFPDMLFRLCAIDAKPINAIIDTTNYVMYDIGQPMHAFDAAHVVDILKIRPATSGEKLVLLDGTSITLSEGDMVTADTEKVLSIAGVMGGKDSSVTKKTSALFIESGSYAASSIRKVSIKYKVRTESSTRYEKSLDPLYNTQAITRFLHLLDIHDVVYQSAQAIISLGEMPEEKTIRFTQTFIADRIGTHVSADQIHTILSALGFGIHQKDTANVTEFTVTVPSFRATKDIIIAEDIVEEIARFIGFNNLAMQLPSRVMKPFSIDYIMTRRALKRLCAFGFNMHEVSNYAFYDNQFLEKIGLNALVSNAVYAVANPVSEHWTNLVSSLIPHLFKNIEQNVHEHDRMAFFEMYNLWKKNNNKPSEQLSFAGIWYQAPELNFYEYKEKVAQILKLLSLPVIWRKPLTELAQYYHPHQTAELVFNDTVIGYAGCVRPDSMRAFAAGHAFIFEIELDTLLHAHKELVSFAPISSYQPVTTDISLLVPFIVSVDALEQAIAIVDARIYQVQLVDYFEKPEWVSERAVTLRYKAVDEEKTFSKQEIDQLRAAVTAAVSALGVTVR
jgi:phenylalanyl-tRNA synthetase beta chain